MSGCIFCAEASARVASALGVCAACARSGGALTGVSNAWKLRNFARAAARARPVPPALVANTLLVPGYVDAAEVAHVARFVAEQGPDIPYSLLAFHPCFLMGDLPPTSRREALATAEAARAAGLRRVRIGNVHLLRDET